MATPIETIVQAYVATVASITSQGNQTREVVDASPSQPEASSSSNINNNNDPSLQPTLHRSFFRRAWDKVESIFFQRDENLPTYYNNYEREDDEDEDDTDEFVHPNPYQQPFTRTAMFRPPVYKRRLSQHSEELISATRSLEEWPTRQTYEDWQRDQGELDIDVNKRDLIAGWAMGEGNPWFD